MGSQSGLPAARAIPQHLQILHRLRQWQLHAIAPVWSPTVLPAARAVVPAAPVDLASLAALAAPRRRATRGVFCLCTVSKFACGVLPLRTAPNRVGSFGLGASAKIAGGVLPLRIVHIRVLSFAFALRPKSSVEFCLGCRRHAVAPVPGHCAGGGRPAGRYPLTCAAPPGPWAGSGGSGQVHGCRQRPRARAAARGRRAGGAAISMRGGVRRQRCPLSARKGSAASAGPYISFVGGGATPRADCLTFRVCHGGQQLQQAHHADERCSVLPAASRPCRIIFFARHGDCHRAGCVHLRQCGHQRYRRASSTHRHIISFGRFGPRPSCQLGSPTGVLPSACATGKLPPHA